MYSVGWLLDDTERRLCFGVCRGRPSMVPYTDDNALRFARKQDAESFMPLIKYLLGVDMDRQRYVDRLVAIEHGWG